VRVGKFLISAPEHTTPRRARAYLVTDDDVSRTAQHFAPSRPQLDDVSRAAILGHQAEPAAWCDTGDAQDDTGEPATDPDSQDMTTPEGALWLALYVAPEEGADIAELLRASGMTRPTLYRHLAQHARAGRAIQVTRGRWRAATTEDGPR